ncbi:MAG: CCA tRNA nucleotidyltransferase [Pseudomonadota bacterium]
MTQRIQQDWLHEPPLQALLKVLNGDGGEAMIAGGAVRNALLSEPIADVDIATTLLPRDVIMRAKQAGFKSVPTGIDHGTITVVAEGAPFEVTTLREDIETDGRHARVIYGTDWRKDAARRDFTMNALYLRADGEIVDVLGGLEDVLARRVIFIGDPEQRIREDYLRILRFFRFFAWYGAFRPDAAGLKASAKLKEGLDHLSAERIWQELSKTFAAPDPSRTLLWMRQTGVLSRVLPESENWGIDAVMPLMAQEQRLGLEPDSLRRLMAIIRPDAGVTDAMGSRLKLPNAVRKRLELWANCPEPDSQLEEDAFRRWLYRQNAQAVQDRLVLALTKNDADVKALDKKLAALREKRPVFPLSGKHLLEKGYEPGPIIAPTLRKLEDIWIDSDFAMEKDELLAKLPVELD